MNCPQCGVSLSEGEVYCSRCGGNPSEAPTQAEAATTASIQHEMERLAARVAALEASLPNSNLLNRKFWLRAFAVLGHNLSAVLAIYAALFVVALLFAVIGAILSAFTK